MQGKKEQRRDGIGTAALGAFVLLNRAFPIEKDAVASPCDGAAFEAVVSLNLTSRFPRHLTECEHLQRSGIGAFRLLFPIF